MNTESGYDVLQNAECLLKVVVFFVQGKKDAFEIAADTSCSNPQAEKQVRWRCHHSLIGDALLARGLRVLDILSAAKAQAHALTQFARVEGHQLTYPGSAQLKFDGT